MLDLLADAHLASDSNVILPFKYSLVTVFISFLVVLFITHLIRTKYYAR